MSEAGTVAAAVDTKTDRIEKILTGEKGKHSVNSLEFPIEGIFQVAAALDENNLLDDATSVADPETGEKKPVEYGDDALVLLARYETGDEAQPYRYRLVAIPSREKLFAIPEVADFAYQLMTTSLARNTKNPDVSIARLQSPIAAVLPKISERPFQLLAPVVLAAMQGKNSPRAFRVLDKTAFRSCLISEAAAKSIAPLIPDENWDLILKVLSTKARKEGMSDLIFRDWLASRHIVRAELADEEVGVLDIDKLSADADEAIAKRDAKKTAKRAETGHIVDRPVDATGRSVE